jgi:hypothetical protein
VGESTNMGESKAQEAGMAEKFVPARELKSI